MHSELSLRWPREDEEEAFLRAHRATSPDVPTFLHSYQEGMVFRRYLEVLREQELGINLPSPQHVPSTFLFAFVGSRIVGRTSIRHRLNKSLEREGGHIGYVVVSEFRRQGYASAILRLALPIAREKAARIGFWSPATTITLDQSRPSRVMGHPSERRWPWPRQADTSLLDRNDTIVLRHNIEMEPTLLTARAIMSLRSAAHLAR